MKKIRKLIENSEKYKNVVVQNELNSDKNTVLYVTIDKKPRVIKSFVPGLKKNMEKESNIYTQFKENSTKIQVPFIYTVDKENNILILEYLNGKNLRNLIKSDDTTNQEKQQIIEMLSIWFLDFHNFFKDRKKEFLIHGEPVLQNFIFTEKIWGVDFEETRKGKPAEDIAGLCASILTTEKMFTQQKIKLCKNFLNSYTSRVPGRIKNINDDIAYAILEKIPEKPEKEEILRKHSKKIRKEGLK